MFKNKSFTLLELHDIMENDMTVKNKFKSILTAILIGIIPNIKADPSQQSNLGIDSSAEETDASTYSDKISSLMDRSVAVSKKILIGKKPNQEQILSLKSKIDSDIGKVFNDSFHLKPSNVDTSQYFQLIMSSYNLTEKDSEYLKVKSILDKLKQEFIQIAKIINQSKSNKQNNLINNGPKMIELVFAQKLISEL
jgi:hypothetical protein